MKLKSSYKQTDVGLIPDDWRCMNLNEVATYFSSGFSKPSTAFTEYPLYGSTGIIGHSSRDDYHGDAVLVARVGANAGQVNRATGRYGVTDNTIILKFPALSCLDFFRYQLISKSLNRLTFGSGQPLITGTQLKQLPVAVPDLPEQHAIANALSDVDELITSLDALIAKKRELKQAAMQQLLTGKTRLQGFSGEWESKRLGEVAKFHKGKGLPKSAISAAGTLPCIHYGELFTTYGPVINAVNSRTSSDSAIIFSISNDVLMPTSDVTPNGLAKASCIKLDDVILGGDILIIRSDVELMLGDFLSYSIRFEEKQVLQLVTGTTVYHLYANDMAKFHLMLPSLNEQRAIAAVLSDLDTELTELEQRRDKTTSLKQGMMQELLTGRTRLV